ncbi:HlyD family secretion protein [Bythopirellula polymerisocia]|uniref:Multidrug export protein EmrA n=1 Tax=Bythopirellula polymerisocia TaxID=2528003 RepID=A0A5C6CXY6_9BACT|nr:HlyD family efflux transporter periplasmic adaptor subunit [Bythopirellula polymerisocia]TWU29420.1 Multidrug export protein EmrA [Bythopirellula polymerisocia]
MTARILAILLVVALLTGLITYSKLRPESNHVSGFIEAEEIRLGSRVGGRVQEVLVEEGSPVEAGQLLVRLEPFDLVQQREVAKANLVASEADLARLEAGHREEEVGQAKARYEQLQAKLDQLVAGARKQEIDAARARLSVAQAEMRLAAQNFNRIQGLASTNAFIKEDYDRATEGLESAKATVTLREEELSLIEAGTREEEIRGAKAQVEEARLAWQLAEKGFRSEEIDAARAARDSAAAALAAIDDRIEELTIKSPVDGVVEALELQPGDLVSTGAPVMSVLDKSHYWVRAYVPQRWMDLELGQLVEVTVDSMPERSFAGEVTFISRRAEFTPSNVQTPEERSKQVFRIKVTLKEGLDVLRPGISADVWLDGVPSDAEKSPP